MLENWKKSRTREKTR